ncbi:hypothetical protein AVEN_134887-1 [Araneus ventricosus]|uniref:Uncharacterized protein n=1 Tax=Araneus ventricosus TaxID=182803 RepID=A0A4Y2CGX0_ARAVE|nr:hypothetical protein AVEN_134887-1 [Araneus ventricosus]
MTIYVRVSPWTPGYRCREHQPLEQPGVNNMERKRQKRESSRLSVFIYPRWSPQAGSQLRHARHDEDRQRGCQRCGPNLLIRIRYKYLLWYENKFFLNNKR